MQTPHLPAPASLRPADLAQIIVQILKANPWLSSEQVLSQIGGPVRNAMDASPDLKNRLLAILDAESQRAALERFQRAHTDPALQREFFTALETAFSKHTALLDDINAAITNIAKEQTRIRRLLALVTAIVGIGVLISIGLFTAFSCREARCELPMETPAPSLFKTAILPQSENRQSWNITALGAHRAASSETLWVGAELIESASSRFVLLRASTKSLNTLDFEILPFQLDRRIWRMAVDCKGNVWLVLHSPDRNAQVRVIRADASDDSARLELGAPNSWFAESNIWEIETTCEGDNVQVWFAQDRVRTMCYSGAYPILYGAEANTSFAPCAARDLVPRGAERFSQPDLLFQNDRYYQESDGFTSVRALAYDDAQHELVFAGQSGQIGIVSDDGARRIVQTGSPAWALGKRDQEIWVGSKGKLTRFTPTNNTAPQSISVTAGRITQLVSTPKWLWLINDCNGIAKCSALQVIRAQTAHPVSIEGAKEVKAIITDARGTLWIGTDNGLRYYSDP